MDFTRNNSGAPQTVRPANQSATPSTAGGGPVKHKDVHTKGFGKWTRVGYAVLLFAATILIVAMAGLIAFGGGNESKYVDTSKYQAVFINDGSASGQSVYFGHITSITSKYMILQNIYYITTSSSSTTATASNSSSYTLTKLGCQQLHDPYDQMIINLDQVAFWENLQNSGKVVTTINQFIKQNPNGPNCSETSSSSTSTGTTQDATSGTTSTTTPTSTSGTSTAVK
jgi:hypothetical protein